MASPMTNKEFDRLREHWRRKHLPYIAYSTDSYRGARGFGILRLDRVVNTNVLGVDGRFYDHEVKFSVAGIRKLARLVRKSPFHMLYVYLAPLPESEQLRILQALPKDYIIEGETEE